MLSIASENLATTAIALIAAGILAWGYFRARPYGKLGVLAWLQSVALMVPWLVFFALFAAGVYLNLAGILLLLVASTGVYIVLGNRLRAAVRDLPPSQWPGAAAPPEESQPAGGETDGDEPGGDRGSENGSENGSDADAGSPPPRDLAPAESNGNTAARPTENGSGRSPVDPPVPAIAPIPQEDLKAIQGIFGIDTFFATDTRSYQDGAIFKGNLRGKPDEVHATLQQKLAAKLGDRYRLFLVESPEKRPTVIVLPSSNDPRPTTPGQWVLAVLLFAGTVATSLEAGGLLQGFDLFQSPERWPQAAPIALGLLAVLGVHEIAHQIWARRHKVDLSPPFFLPVLQIGTFGAFNRFASLLPNRQALCDIALAGPIAGGALALLMLLLGLEWSGPGSAFQIPSEFFQGSILVGSLARVVLGSALQQPLVDVHPLAVVGWLGLVVTAINLMPAGQLDGGRIVQAIYGRKVAGRATIATLIVLAIASLSTPLALYWAVAILFLQRNLERPALEELTEPDDARASLGLLALFLMVATLLPLTPTLAGRLGIGG